jgi:hypothetical protein
VTRSNLLPGLLLLTVACTRNASEQFVDSAVDTALGPIPAIASGDSAQPIACEGLELTILRTTAQRASMRAMFGPPDSVRATTEPNRHLPEVTDSLFVLYYPGLTADIRKPHQGGDMPVHVRVSDTRYLAYPQVGVGVPLDNVIRLLGEPTSRAATSLSYDCGIGAEQPVIFHFDAGRVSSVEIQYYVD